MAVDVRPYLAEPGDLVARTRSTLAEQMQPSRILAIAAEVLDLKARGEDVANFTIGDFAPTEFRPPPSFLAHLRRFQEAGQTFYPPAVGTPELRAAIRRHYEATLGLALPEGTIQVGSGARPLIYAAFACLVSPGDVVLYQVPSWNTNYYTGLNFAEGIELVARPEHGFMLTADDLRPHLGRARLLVINSPQNPSGTAMSAEAMTEICTAVVAENRRREAAGERPLFLLYDMVYWRLTLEGVEHVTPISLVPEMARYCVLVDAISKSWAATGVRVGWAYAPPWLREPMKALVGHMGAWAGRAPQLATAAALDDEVAGEGTIAEWMAGYRARVAGRQLAVYERLADLQRQGLPVEPVAPEGALYVTARFPLHGRRLGGRTLETDEDVRSALLHHAGTAVVPFVSFGYPEGSGWMRFSIGAVTDDDIAGALDRLEALLRTLA
jgi:aspartate aminotransferase